MSSSLNEVLARAREEAAEKGPLPGVAVIIEKLETEAIQKLFEPPASPPLPRKSVLVAVGGQIDGCEFLNVNGIK